MFSTLLTGRLAVGLAAGVVTVTGAATAAYACVLPSPIQSFAHTTIGAPKPSGPKLTAGSAVSAVDAITSNHDIDPSVSPSVTPSPSVTVSASTSASAKADEGKSKVLAADPSEAAAVEALLVYRSCLNFTAATKAGKTLDGKDLAILVKAAGSSSAIAAYCAALPVPPNRCIAAPLTTASPTATPSPTVDPKNLKGYWWRWCGICPAVTVTPTVSPTATATTDADGDNDGSGMPRHLPWFWCGDRDPKGTNSADPSHTAKPLPQLSRVAPKSTTAFSDNGFGGFGFGANDNHGGSFGQSGKGSGQQHR